MHLRKYIVVHATVLTIISAVGCSKGSSHQTQPANSSQKTTDLGMVELTPQSPRQFELGANKCCIITGKPLPNGIEVKLVVLTTNTDGTVTRTQGQIITLPGRSCGIGFGDSVVSLTPALKTQ
jgi:hypothetical protein